MTAYPKASWTEYTPINDQNERQGMQSATGGAWRPLHDLSHARVIVSLGADLLGAGPEQVRNTRGWADGRTAANGHMNRMWVAETAMTLTGANADERQAMRPAEIVAVAAALADIKGTQIDGLAELSADQQAWVGRMAKDLTAAGKHGLVVAGRGQPPLVHHLAAIANDHIGAVGTTVSFVPAVTVGGSTLEDLTDRMKKQEVATLIILGGNPVFDAPGGVDFAAAMSGVQKIAHLSLFDDETSEQSDWHVNAAHWLESWGDGRFADGTMCMQQPLIRPLFNGVTASEFLAMLAGESKTDGYALVRETHGAKDEWNKEWRAAIHDGIVRGSTADPEAPPISNAIESGLPAGMTGVGLQAVFVPDASVWDGRFANNGWLQELPDTITKLTWDTAVLVSPATAEANGFAHSDIIEVSVGDVTVELPVLPVPGTADDVLVLPMGGGRQFAGRVCTGSGTDVYPLRATSATWVDAVKSVRRTGGTYPLATTQMHFPVDSTLGKGLHERLPLLYREGTLDTYQQDPHFAREAGHSVHTLSMWEEQQFDGAKYKWGMSIDLSSCTGCNACVMACQAENNIPIVGKDQVLMGREMHWIRIDRYFAFEQNASGEWNANHPSAVAIQPVTCHHCENAPCEEVCPVAATVHDTDGLNSMVYNRCIGTRYCSNNCPFKVRRFNYFDFFRRDPLRSTGLLQVQPDYYIKRQSGGKTLRAMQFNPEVTVRMRGVMEKCTYCTQRIQAVKIQTKNAWVKNGGDAKAADQRVALRDGAIVTACEQACPAGAIVFGDLMDKDSRVAKLHAEPRSYEMLEELNLKSRTKYLARLTNPVAGQSSGDGSHH